MKTFFAIFFLPLLHNHLTASSRFGSTKRAFASPKTSPYLAGFVFNPLLSRRAIKFWRLFFLPTVSRCLLHRTNLCFSLLVFPQRQFATSPFIHTYRNLRGFPPVPLFLSIIFKGKYPFLSFVLSSVQPLLHNILFYCSVPADHS